MLPKCHRRSRLGGVVLGEVTARPEAIQCREDVLYWIGVTEGLEDRFDLMDTVQQRRKRRVDGIRHPCLLPLRQQKKPIIRDDGLYARLEAWTCRRLHIHPGRPAQQQPGARRWCRSRGSLAPFGLRSNLTILVNFLPTCLP